MKQPAVLMLFVDGLGMPPPSVPTPLRRQVCPRLMRLLAENCTPIDATLGVPGLPQSATGQTALFTGINAPARVGRHMEGFPGPALCDLIKPNSIYRQLQAVGLSSTFANGYCAETVADVDTMRIKSVTTVAALSAFGDVRRRDKLFTDQAVAHDLTRETLRPRGYTGSTITPEAAATHLSRIAQQHHFTLFEYFRTDHSGHRGDIEEAEAILHMYDRFLDALCPLLDQAGILLLLTSDHGNIEDMSVHTHTQNPVPCIVRGPGSPAILDHVQALTDVCPAIVGYLTSC